LRRAKPEQPPRGKPEGCSERGAHAPASRPSPACQQHDGIAPAPRCPASTPRPSAGSRVPSPWPSRRRLHRGRDRGWDSAALPAGQVPAPGVRALGTVGAAVTPRRTPHPKVPALREASSRWPAQQTPVSPSAASASRAGRARPEGAQGRGLGPAQRLSKWQEGSAAQTRERLFLFPIQFLCISRPSGYLSSPSRALAGKPNTDEA